MGLVQELVEGEEPCQEPARSNMSNDATRKKPGRPPTLEGTPRTYAVRLPENLVKSFERFVQVEGIARSEALRRLIAEGLKAK